MWRKGSREKRKENQVKHEGDMLDIKSIEAYDCEN